jgi:uncharacterized protein
VTITPPFAAAVARLELEPWPLAPDQVVEGAPEVRGLVLHEDDAGERGVWEHTPGVSRDVEADELFVVVSGRATIELAGGQVLEVGPGDVAVLPEGARSVWRVHETLRKVFQVRRSRPLHLTGVATVVVPVTDQDEALAFYVGRLGMRKINDFTYETGERWLEVSPAEGSANLCLVAARPERPAGIETGVVLMSADVLGDLAALRAEGVDVDDAPLPEGEVVWWSGAPLAGMPTQFLLRDPDGNSLLMVAAAPAQLSS